MNSLRLTTGIVAVCSLFLACNKTEPAADNPVNTAERMTVVTSSEIQSSLIFEDAGNSVLGSGPDIGIVESEPGFDGPVLPTDPNRSKCFTRTITRLTAEDFPKKIVLDFGAGCLGRDGNLRAGKIITTISGRIAKPGSVATTTFEGYSINGIKVSGTLILTNKSTSSVLVVQKKVENGQLILLTGELIKWNSNFTSSVIDGLGTPNYHWDDVVKITGEAAGTLLKDGKEIKWVRNITEPLIKKNNCRWVSKGIVRIVHGTYSATLNFGNGDCDNKAILLFDGIEYPITLP